MGRMVQIAIYPTVPSTLTNWLRYLPMSKLRMIHCGKMILYSDDNENDNNNNNKDKNDKWELGGPPTVGLCQLHRRAELQALQAKT